MKALSQLTWHDVQKVLKPNEAAVEYVRFPVHNGVVWMHANAYAALVLTPSGPPRLMLLGNAQKLEGDPVAAYRAEVAQTRGVSAAPAKAATETGADAAPPIPHSGNRSKPRSAAPSVCMSRPMAFSTRFRSGCSAIPQGNCCSKNMTCAW